jgi:hypothetical protein
VTPLAAISVALSPDAAAPDGSCRQRQLEIYTHFLT